MRGFLRFGRRIGAALAAGALSAAVAAAACAGEPPTLTVYTYSSFTEEWGPGPSVKTAFEAQCACRLEYVSLEDGVSLLTRLRLEGQATKADVVLGLDTNLTAEAAATGLFAPHGLDLSGLKLPVAWTDPLFVPFDYGYFAFIYDKTKLADPPHSLAELVDGDPAQKILIEDPRTSTPGLGLLLWMRQVYGDKAGEAWRKLKPRVLTVSKSWSEAYGLFLKGEAPLVLSYTTSPAYHIVAENKDNYAAAAFAEGHYLQIEVAGRVKSSKHPELAEKFLAFMISPGFQDHIPTGNWMYPVAATSQPLPAAFDTLVKPAKALAYTPEEVAAHRKQWIDEWLAAMSE
ncbi:MAG: thiamine ABC transporter substrate binding subunit [Rhodospirillaceae bacterium]|nr:thiamine ABC transporter substrate binding subunit [Rhodospirillaceae bacterium]